MSEEEQVKVHQQGMFWAATREEAEALAVSLQSTLAWVTLRKAYQPSANGFQWCVYFKEPYNGRD